VDNNSSRYYGLFFRAIPTVFHSRIYHNNNNDDHHNNDNSCLRQQPIQMRLW
jgi:hypothetical protein